MPPDHLHELAVIAAVRIPGVGVAEPAKCMIGCRIAKDVAADLMAVCVVPPTVTELLRNVVDLELLHARLAVLPHLYRSVRLRRSAVEVLRIVLGWSARDGRWSYQQRDDRGTNRQ